MRIQMTSWTTVLVSSGYHNKTLQVGWLKQQTFISNSCEGWEVQCQGVGRFGSWEGSVSWVANRQASLSLGSHMLSMREREREKEKRQRQRDRKLSCVLISVLIPFMMVLPSQCNYLLKASFPNTITLEIRVSTNKFRRSTNAQPINH